MPANFEKLLDDPLFNIGLGLLSTKTPGEGIAAGVGLLNQRREQETERKYREALLNQKTAKKSKKYEKMGNHLLEIDEETGTIRPAYTLPSTGLINPETGLPERKLSATEQKELFDTMDLTSSGESAKGALLKARDILTNSPAGAEPYTGFAAETRAAAARLPLIGNVIADKDRGAATTEYKTLVTEQALNNLKAIFGGMPTEGERQILLQMQALPDYTPEEQQRIIDNAVAAADRRIQFNKQKSSAITTGQYSTMGSAPSTPSTGGTGKVKFLGFE